MFGEIDWNSVVSLCPKQIKCQISELNQILLAFIGNYSKMFNRYRKIMEEIMNMYKEPEMEVVLFSAEDIIRTSGGYDDDETPIVPGKP